MTKNPSIAAQLHLAYEARDWALARRLFTDDAVLVMHATAERFDGADAILHFNQVYPDGWRLTVLEDNALTDGRLHTLTRVDQGEARYFASTLFTLRGGRIARMDEHWGTAEAPPAWRVGLPGWSRIG